MPQNTPFFSGFHKALFGRKPVSEIEKIKRRRNKASRLCARQLRSLFGSFIPGSPLGAKPEKGSGSRERVFTPEVTFWAFLSQVLDPGSSCSKAVARVQALFGAAGSGVPSGETGAYCAARSRLSVRALVKLRDHIVSRLCPASPGGRFLLVDGSGLSAPDTAANQGKFPQQRSQKEGCGFPAIKIVGLFDLASGAWLACARSCLHLHESRLFRRLYRYLREGDTVVTDRGFCSYWAIAELGHRGVDILMRNHQRRRCDFRKGVRLGRRDHLIIWEKPQRPSWMDKGTYKAMPDHIVLREVKTRRERRGFRTEEVVLVTTHLLVEEYSREELGDIYLHRWRVELFFDDIKTTMGMDVLRTKTPAMLCRELLMHMIAYNLIRALIARSGGDPHRVSFKGAVECAEVWAPLFWGCGNRTKMLGFEAELLDAVASNEVSPRPGRREPRAVKRRPKTYQLLTKPRKKMVEQKHRGKKAKAA